MQGTQPTALHKQRTILIISLINNQSSTLQIAHIQKKGVFN